VKTALLAAALKTIRQLLLLVGLCVALTRLPGQTVLVWTGIGDDGLFGTAENWSPMQSPGELDTVKFGPIGPIYSVVAVEDGQEINHLEFLATRDVAYHLQSDSDGSTMYVGGDVTVAVGPDVFFDSDLNLVLGSGEHIFDIVDDTTTLTIGGVISGDGHFTKMGNGTLVLTGANTFNYDGEGGMLQSTAIRGGTVILDGGDINHDTAGDIWIGIDDGENARLLVQSGGSVSGYTTVLGHNDGSTGSANLYGTGSTWTLAADLQVGLAGTGSLVIEQGGVLTANGSESVVGYHSSGSGNVTILDPGSAWHDSSSVQIGASGVGTVTVGSGGLLTAPNLFLGANASGSGTLIVNDSGSTVNATVHVGRNGTGELFVTNGGTVSGTGGAVGVQAGSTGTVLITGSGSTWQTTNAFALGPAGTGVVTLQNQGLLNVGAGEEALILGGALGGSGTLNIGADSAAAAAAGGFLNAAEIITGSGAGTLQFNTTADILNRYYLTNDGTESGNAIAVGGATQLIHTAGYTVLLSDNTYTGGTTIAGGYLLLGYYGTVGSIVGNVTFTGNVDPNGGELQFVRSDNTTFAGNITGPGRVSNFGAGTVTLSGANSYTGETFVSGGAIADGGVGTLSPGSVFRLNTDSSLLLSFNETIAGLGDFALASAGTVNFGVTPSVLTLDVDGSWTFSGVITGAGGIRKTGSGVEVLKGASNYTGNTVVEHGTLALEGGSINYVFGGPSVLNIGPALGDDATVLISNGGGIINANATLIGAAAGSTGHITVDGAGSSLVTWTGLKVGYLGDGSLTLSGGATASNYTGYVGDASDSIGTATVTGAGTTWNSVGHLLVGNFGSGTLDILDGGHVDAATGDSSTLIHIGYATGSTGTVTVSGAGSQLQSHQSLLVGQSGFGVLNIDTGGAVIVATFADIGEDDGGVGYLNLSSGGTLSNSSSVLGWAAGSAGHAAVDGAGSTWTLTDGLYVGHSGGGTLSITDGGSVINLGTSNSTIVGVNSGSTGSVTVDGNGSSWSIDDELMVGAGGVGLLAITNGAGVTSSAAFLGDTTSGNGSALVNGFGSSWSTALTGIGVDGIGLLEISDGGSMTSTFGYVGYSSGSTGEVTVDAGSWSASDYLYIGVEGDGALDIHNGGAVSSPNTSIGNNAGGTGAVTVDGDGSLLLNANTLYVGSEGSGTLTIANGGTVTNVTGSVGNNTGGTGSVTVTGSGSGWSNSGNLLVGNAATGGLLIDDHGAVDADNLFLGVLAGINGVGSLNNHSILNVSTNLVVGNSGAGSLGVSSGSQVNANANVVIGNNAGSTGQITLEGSDTTLTTGGNIYIGNVGNGHLYLLDGATVTAGAGDGDIVLGHLGGSGILNIGYDGDDTTLGGIINVNSITTETGTGLLILGTDSAADSPYFLTKDGTPSGAGVAIHGNTAVAQEGGFNILKATSTYTGGTTIYSGTLYVGDAGALGTGAVTIHGGSLGVLAGITFSNPLTLNSGARLTGNGTFGSPITVGSGVHLAPGNSPGTLTFNSGLTLADGGFLDFEVQAATDVAGSGYDTVVVTGGALDLSAVSAGGFTLKLISLNALGDPGNVSDFDFTNSYSWTVFSTDGITGFDANKFTLDLGGFTNDLSIGNFVVAQSGNNVLLNFSAVPEPSTWALLALGLATGTFAHWRRSRRRE
jgi:T5SS/PEP-CTERM-associated repeat protein/autotransporter-associated beta strand protein